MTNEELVALIQAGDHVQDNMGQLYQQNRNFIVGIALPFSDAADMDDLMQEAYFGLYKAAEKFDPDLGFKFLTYAEHPIRASVLRYCQNNGRLKRVPVHVLEQISKYQKFRCDFRAVTGSEPTDDEFCSYLGIRKSQLKDLRTYMAGAETVSLDQAIPGTENFTLAETIADDFNLEESVVDRVGDQQAKAVIWGAVSDLPGKEPIVISGYYKDGKTLDEISDSLGVSTERVRQLKQRAIIALRRNHRLKEAAEIYGYGCSQVYHWGVGRFKDTGTSSTEFLALKHIEQEQSLKMLTQEIQDNSTLATLSADRMEKENGYIPIGVQKWEATMGESEKLLQEAEALIKRNQKILRERKMVKSNAKARKP